MFLELTKEEVELIIKFMQEYRSLALVSRKDYDTALAIYGRMMTALTEGTDVC